MTELRCPSCGTVYDVSRYPNGHRFQCTCGTDLQVAPPAAVGAMPASPPPPPPTADAGL